MWCDPRLTFLLKSGVKIKINGYIWAPGHFLSFTHNHTGPKSELVAFVNVSKRKLILLN